MIARHDFMIGGGVNGKLSAGIECRGGNIHLTIAV